MVPSTLQPVKSGTPEYVCGAQTRHMIYYDIKDTHTFIFKIIHDMQFLLYTTKHHMHEHTPQYIGNVYRECVY